MKRSTLAGSVAACFYLGLVVPALAAEPNATGTVNRPSPSEMNVSAIKFGEKCLSDLRAFDNQTKKDGYWLVGSGCGSSRPGQSNWST